MYPGFQIHDFHNLTYRLTNCWVKLRRRMDLGSRIVSVRWVTRSCSSTIASDNPLDGLYKLYWPYHGPRYALERCNMRFDWKSALERRWTAASNLCGLDRARDSRLAALTNGPSRQQ
jgi:hypothetical protein